MKELTDKTLIPLGIAILAFTSAGMFVAKVSADSDRITSIEKARSVGMTDYIQFQKDQIKELKDLNAQLTLLNYQVQELKKWIHKE